MAKIVSRNLTGLQKKLAQFLCLRDYKSFVRLKTDVPLEYTGKENVNINIPSMQRFTLCPFKEHNLIQKGLN